MEAFNSIPLTLRDGGIFPQYQTGDDFATRTTRALELRARARLAWGFSNEKLKPFIRLERDCQLVLLTNGDLTFSSEELHWSATKEINSGFIKTSGGLSVSIDNQPCRLFLYAERLVNIDAALRVYFTASLRWLADGNNSVVSNIEKSFESV